MCRCGHSVFEHGPDRRCTHSYTYEDVINLGIFVRDDSSPAVAPVICECDDYQEET